VSPEIVLAIEIKPRRRKARMTARRELRAVEREVRRGDRMETESVAFLQHHTDGLAPDFDDEGFGHGWISRLALTWPRSPGSTMVGIAEPALAESKSFPWGINMAITTL
jgi:hypothetical protein